MVLSYTKERILSTQAGLLSASHAHFMLRSHACLTLPAHRRSVATLSQLLVSQAKIHPYFPYFHVDVMALVFMFKPAVGVEIGAPAGGDDSTCMIT